MGLGSQSYGRRALLDGLERVLDLVQSALGREDGVIRIVRVPKLDNGSFPACLGHLDENACHSCDKERVNACTSGEMALTSTIYEAFDSLRYKPPNGCYTVLAGFYLVDDGGNRSKVISLATGTKCLPVERYSKSGEVVHDFHAEVLARRGAVYWLLCEMRQRAISGKSDWLAYDQKDDLWALKPDVSLHMYISELPCTSNNPLECSNHLEKAARRRRGQSHIFSPLETHKWRC